MPTFHVIDTNSTVLHITDNFPLAKARADEGSTTDEWLTVYAVHRETCVYDGSPDGNGTYLVNDPEA